MKWLVLLVVLSAGVARAQQGLDVEQCQRVLAAAKQQWAPDRRTVVFDVTATVRDEGVVLAGEVQDLELRQRLVQHFRDACKVAVVDQLRALPDPALGERTLAVVGVSVANLRSKPGHSQELGTQVLLGTPLRILKEEGGWSYVQTPNDYLCWTNDRLERMNPKEFASWQKQAKVIITATFTTVLSSKDTNSRPISDAVAGGLLALVDAADGYYRVRYADGREGFLKHTAAQPYAEWLSTADDDPQQLIATGRRFFGVPYLWGGTSSKGMDCSGFTSTVWFLNGVLLPRDASQQVHAGVAVPFDDSMQQVKAGDLLFFGRRATDNRSERVTHVAMSLGGMRFLHASTDVHENSFDPAADDYSASLKQSLLHVRRVINQDAAHGVRSLKEHPLYRLQ